MVSSQYVISMFLLAFWSDDGRPLALAGCDGAAKAFGGGERGTGDCQIGFSYAGGTGSIQGKSE